MCDSGFSIFIKAYRCSAFNYVYSISFLLPAFAITSRFDTTSLDFFYIATPGTFVLRTFAIYERSWTVFFLLAIPGLLIVASQIVIFGFYSLPVLLTSLKVGCCYGYCRSSSSATPNWAMDLRFLQPFFCFCRVRLYLYLCVSLTSSLVRISSFLRMLSHSHLAELVSIASLAVFDVFVLVLTVSRTARLAWQSRRMGVRRSLICIMLRDGG